MPLFYRRPRGPSRTSAAAVLVTLGRDVTETTSSTFSARDLVADGPTRNGHTRQRELRASGATCRTPRRHRGASTPPDGARRRSTSCRYTAPWPRLPPTPVPLSG